MDKRMHQYSLIEKIKFNIQGFIEILVILIACVFVFLEYVSPLIIWSLYK
jgi:hypothetical protein